MIESRDGERRELVDGRRLHQRHRRLLQRAPRQPHLQALARRAGAARGPWPAPIIAAARSGGPAVILVAAAARREYRHRGARHVQLRADRSAAGGAARRLAQRQGRGGGERRRSRARARRRLFDTVEGAIADLRHVYATTARDRYMVKRVADAAPGRRRDARASSAAGEALRHPLRARAHRAPQRPHRARRYGAERAAQPRLLLAQSGAGGAAHRL